MKYSIIIVDDDVNILNGYKRVLHNANENWNLIYCDSAKMALSICEKENINIIITDYKMPLMNGLELLTNIKIKYPNIKRILLTGQSEEEVFDRSKDITDKYLSKPCSADLIIKTIEEFL